MKIIHEVVRVGKSTRIDYAETKDLLRQKKDNNV